MRKHRIVLYNPRAPFYTMPLGLVAIASALDRSRFDVTIVDGRLERDPMARVLEATDGALCLGIGVLTGIPIADALAVTEAVQAGRPGCRIVWGGWHPSLFPSETLAEAGVDAVIVGQGERAFAEIVEAFAAGEQVSGIVSRPMGDINDFPEHDYSLITDELARSGYPLPRSLREWAAIERDSSRSPWVDAGKRAVIERFRFYQRIGWAKPSAWRMPIQAVARWRCQRDVYAFPIEKAIAEWMRPSLAS